MAESTRVGWIGTGVMGSIDVRPPDRRPGYSVTVYNRTRERAEPLLERGRGVGRLARGGGAQRPTSCSRSSAIPADVREVVLGERRRARRRAHRAASSST